MKRRILIMALSLVMAVTLAFGLFAYAAESAECPPDWMPYPRKAKAPRGFETVATLNGITLMADKNNAAIRVVDAVGKVWDSTPEKFDEDTTANGGGKMAMQSLVSISYTDKVGNQTTLNGYAESVKKNKYGCKNIENGLRFDFSFERIGAIVPITVTLEESGLVVRVLADEIYEESEEYNLTSVTVMPYFGASKADEEGYFLLPDGCGALVEFNQAPTDTEPYRQAIYGSEPATTALKKESISQTAYLPLFGVKKNDAAFLGVITKGASTTVLNAQSAGDRTDYFNLAPEFVYRVTDLVLVEKKNQTVRMVQKGRTEIDCFEITYHFLDGKEADYNGMAKLYRETYLAGKQADQAADLHLEFVGGAKATVNVMGFPVTKVQPFTSFADAANILDELTAEGIRLSATYLYWQAGGAESATRNDFKAESVLGGDRGLASLIDACNEKKIPLYPRVDILNIFENRIGCLGQSDGVKNIQKGPAEQYTYRLSDGGANVTLPNYLLAHQKVVDFSTDLSADRQKRQNQLPGIDATALGNTLYSDFGNRQVSRTTAEGLFTTALSNVKGEGKLQLSAPCGYALPLADSVIDVPDSSSHEPLETAEIPFYQLVTHGVVNLASLPINTSENRQKSLLSAAALAITPTYRVLTQNEDKVYKTCLNDVMNGLWSEEKEEIKQSTEALKQVLKAAGNSTIVAYTFTKEGASHTLFENGTEVFVNSAESTQQIDGVTLKAGEIRVGNAGKGDEVA